MLRQCLKCGAEAEVADSPTAACPHCGAIYAKVEAARAKAESEAAARAAVPSPAAPPPPAPIQQQQPAPAAAKVSRPGSGAVTGGWVCIVLGVLIMQWSLILGLLFYGALFLAAFILGIVAMTQQRVAAGVSILLCSILVPIVFGLGLASYRAAQLAEAIDKAGQTPAAAATTAATSATTPTAAARDAIEVLSWECSKTSYGAPAITGELRNISGAPIPFLRINGTFRDAAGKLLNSDYVYSDLNPLPAGQSVPFRIAGDEHPSFSKCELTFQANDNLLKWKDSSRR